MSLWCLQFLPKIERKQVDLRFHSSKVEFVRSFFGRNVGLKKLFRLCLTFKVFRRLVKNTNTKQTNTSLPGLIFSVGRFDKISWKIY